MTTSIIGTAHTRFGRLEYSIYELIEKVGKEVLADADIDGEKIGGLWLGNFSGGGFNNQEHLAPYLLNIDPGLRFVPSTRVENACASGSAAIEAAVDAVESGRVEYALVVGAEKMTDLDTKGVTDVLAMASYWPEEGAKGITFPGLFAEYAKGYREKFGFSAEELSKILAKVAAKNHRNAVENPLAQMPWDCNYQDIINKEDKKNPIIADPLRLFDCSLVSDGAAAVIITSTENARRNHKKYIEIAALSHTSDYLSLSKRANYEFTAGKIAIEKAYQQAGIKIEDLDFAEVHDCFTIAEILAYEAMGLAEAGKGGSVLEDGTVEKDGRLPVNLSGGLKAKGHPVGTTGVSMAVLAARQLMRESIGIQLDNPKYGLTFNIGGSAASNYALIFKRPE